MEERLKNKAVQYSLILSKILYNKELKANEKSIKDNVMEIRIILCSRRNFDKLI